MRHNKKVNHLGRTSSHRKAMLANMACSLITWKRIETTLAKAKALRVYFEPLITKSKTANNAVVNVITKQVVIKHKDGTLETKAREYKLNSSTHSRHVVFSYLKDKAAVQELFGNIAPRVADRPGGYLRILKTGFRQGDAAEMAMIEFVDFNELTVVPKSPEKKTTRRSRKKTVAEPTEK